MLINFSEFRQRLKSLNLSVYRDKAATGTEYPYWVYTYVNQGKITASGTNLQSVPEYQVSLFTKGTETDLKDFQKAFKDVGYTDFRVSPGDENDETVNNFYTYIRVIDDE